MKNAKRKSKAERQPVVEELQSKVFCCQILRDDFKTLMKNQTKYASRYDGNLLKMIRFELENDVLTMVSTDGNRMLETTTRVYDAKGSGFGLYDAGYIRAIKLMKNICINSECYVDVLDLTFYEDRLQIRDIANHIEYNVPAYMGDRKYPEWKKLYPNSKEIEKDYTTIAMNYNFFEDLKALSPNPKTMITKLQIKNNDPLAKIIVECPQPDTTTRVLIMPIQIR